VLKESAGVLNSFAEFISALCIVDELPVLSIHLTVLSKLISSSYIMTSLEDM